MSPPPEGGLLRGGGWLALTPLCSQLSVLFKIQLQLSLHDFIYTVALTHPSPLSIPLSLSLLPSGDVIV